MRFSKRLDQVPPYLFAELERKISAKESEGIDVISLGIGDPDLPTPVPVIEAAARAMRDPATHDYPTNHGTSAFREAVASFYRDRFGVDLAVDGEIVPVLGGKEGVSHVALIALDPGDLCLAPDPGYPPYTSGPLFAGSEPYYLPLEEKNGFLPDLDSIPEDVLSRANLLFLNYPNNPTGAIVREGYFGRAVEFARANDLIVVHDSAYSEICFEAYRAPSFLETPGAKDVGVEIFSLSKGWNMTGWRCALMAGNAEIVERYRQLKTNIDSGMFEAMQAAAAAALDGGTRLSGRDVGRLRAPSRPRHGRAARDRPRRNAAPGHAVLLGARARRIHVGKLLRARPRAGGGRRLAGFRLRPERRGIRPDLAHDPRRPAGRGGFAHRVRAHGRRVAVVIIAL